MIPKPSQTGSISYRERLPLGRQLLLEPPTPRPLDIKSRDAEVECLETDLRLDYAAEPLDGKVGGRSAHGKNRTD
jgi:hypothetical protein